jgi:hypothetical protein
MSKNAKPTSIGIKCDLGRYELIQEREMRISKTKREGTVSIFQMRGWVLYNELDRLNNTQSRSLASRSSEARSAAGSMTQYSIDGKSRDDLSKR